MSQCLVVRKGMAFTDTTHPLMLGQAVESGWVDQTGPDESHDQQAGWAAHSAESGTYDQSRMQATSAAQHCSSDIMCWLGR